MRELCGTFWTYKIKAQNLRGKFRSIFHTKIRSSKQIVPKLALQTCHFKKYKSTKKYVLPRTDPNKYDKAMA